MRSGNLPYPGLFISRRNREFVVDPEREQAWHVTSRCARELFLLDEPPPEFGGDDRCFAELAGARKWLLLDRLERLEALFCIVVIGYSVMGNHLHLILRSVPTEGRAWSASEVVRRWFDLHPPRDHRGLLELTPELLAEAAADTEFVAATRRKLMNLSQFMKDLKQYVAVEGNKLADGSGPFWGGRFKCKPITDVERGQLVKTMIYVDLNPMAAGLCTTPEAGRFTSLSCRLNLDEDPRVEPALTTARSSDLRPVRWLVPMEADPAAAVEDRPRRVVVPGLTLIHYLALLDLVARLTRRGKSTLPRSAAGIFERLGLDADDLLTGFPRFARGSPHF